MPLPCPTLVILDMDGTTVRHLNPRLLHVLEIIDDMIYRLRQFLNRLRSALGLTPRWNPHRTSRKPRLIVHRALHRLRRKPVEQIVEPCPGIIDLLELFKANKIPVGLISSGLGEGYGHDILEKFDLLPLFETSVFREDTHKSKPNPEPLLEAIGRLKPDLQKTDVIWYIGDRAKDVAAAVSSMAHIPARIIPIGYGYHASLALFERNLGADHLVWSYEDWYPIVADILTAAPAPPIQIQIAPV